MKNKFFNDSYLTRNVYGISKSIDNKKLSNMKSFKKLLI